jgi:hypothetical protein
MLSVHVSLMLGHTMYITVVNSLSKLEPWPICNGSYNKLI